jgi:hypothetical protein
MLLLLRNLCNNPLNIRKAELATVCFHLDLELHKQVVISVFKDRHEKAVMSSEVLVT